MPTRKSTANIDPISTVAASILAEDEQLRARVQGLVDTLLGAAEYTARYGTFTEKAQLMRMIVTPLLRSLQKADSGGGETAQAEAYARMLEAMRGGDMGIAGE